MQLPTECELFFFFWVGVGEVVIKNRKHALSEDQNKTKNKNDTKSSVWNIILVFS